MGLSEIEVWIRDSKSREKEVFLNYSVQDTELNTVVDTVINISVLNEAYTLSTLYYVLRNNDNLLNIHYVLGITLRTLLILIPLNFNYFMR